jgi:hypothetical protein
VFGYLSLPVEPDDARRDLRALVSLYFAEPRSRTARVRRRS